MSDAKIIEFKKYGVDHIIPHIATIAATEDADFVISVLDKAYTEMNERAKVLGNLGVSNLKSFRKKTGLARDNSDGRGGIDFQIGRETGSTHCKLHRWLCEAW